MDTEKKYAVITCLIGNDTGNEIEIKVVEYLGKLLTCTVCDTPMGAIKEFESKVNMLCWNKCLFDCMKSYYKGEDGICRDIFLCAEDDDRNTSLWRVSIVLAGER